MIRRTFLKGAAAVSFSLMVSPALTAFAKDSVRVYVGGPIFTMNKNNDIAEAIAVKVKRFWPWARRPRLWLLRVRAPP